MSGQFPYLFSPLKVGKLTLKNRIVFGPHATSLADQEGIPTRVYPYYFAERAKGGAGLIIIENACVHPTGKFSYQFLNGWDRRILPGLQRTAELVHEAGAYIFGQVNHCGHSTLLKPPQILWAPSEMPEASSRYMCKAIEKEDIEATIEGFVLTVRHYKEAGFDGIDLKAAAHDGLLRSFVSPYFNRRDDEYGGSFENRLRLPVQVMQAIRDEIGPEMVFGIRVCLDEFTPWGYSLDYGLEVARALLAPGLADYIYADAGTYSSFYMEIPPAAVPLGFAVYMSAALKEITELPVIAFGRINDPVLAEQVLADGHADLIGLARPLLADPEWPMKAYEGRLDEIAHCIACNDGCLLQVEQDRPIRCIHNPAGGREEELGMGTRKPAEVRKRVLVVGGGIGGLKVAAVAAERGHQVTLVERGAELGGQINLAAKQPLHAEIADIPRYLTVLAQKHGTEIRLGEEATVESVLAAGADVVVIATGSRPTMPEGVEGLEAGHVYTVHDVLGGSANVGERVLVYDYTGYWPGAGTAEYVLEQGKEVILATHLGQVALDLEPSNREMFYQRVRPKGMQFVDCSALTRIEGDRVTLTDVYSGEEHILEGIDTVILATLGQSNANLYFALKGRVKELHRVGDCVVPRMVQQVVYEAELLGRAI